MVARISSFVAFCGGRLVGCLVCMATADLHERSACFCVSLRLPTLNHRWLSGIPDVLRGHLWVVNVT